MAGDRDIFKRQNPEQQVPRVPDNTGFDYTFTVFTPTFNRAHTLHRVYRSLAAQTFRDFEWLVIDDGSSDDTRDKVLAWKSAADFPIRYVFQSNGGKHTAVNRGVREARGRLFLTIDSDDEFVPEALERFRFHWESIPFVNRPQYSAVTALCMDPSGRVVGSRFPSDVIDSDTIEMFHKYRVRGEKWGFHRTDVMRLFPFPEEGIKGFVTEAVVWRAIARQYRTRYVNEMLRIYYVPERGNATDNLSNTGFRRQARGMRCYCLDAMNNDLAWFLYTPLEFVRLGANYIRASLHCKVSPVTQWKQLSAIAARGLWILCLVLGYALYLRDHRRSFED